MLHLTLSLMVLFRTQGIIAYLGCVRREPLRLPVLASLGCVSLTTDLNILTPMPE